jgi:hypothetical protein
MRARWGALLLLWCIAFAANAQSREEQEMNEKASALTKLTAYVDAVVVFSPGGRERSDLALLEGAFENNATLKPLLGGHVLRLQRGDRGVVVLVCTTDAAAALLEDLSCTGQIDKHRWREGVRPACEFTLSAAACP